MRSFHQPISQPCADHVPGLVVRERADVDHQRVLAIDELRELRRRNGAVFAEKPCRFRRDERDQHAERERDQQAVVGDEFGEALGGHRKNRDRDGGGARDYRAGPVK